MLTIKERGENNILKHEKKKLPLQSAYPILILIIR